MHPFSRSLFALLSLLILGSCSSKGTAGKGEPERLLPTELSADEANIELSELSQKIALDPEMTKRERGFLAYDYRMMKKWQVHIPEQGNQLKDVYSTIFGNQESPNLYLFERIKAIGSVKSLEPGTEENMGAMNFGFSMWMDQLLKDPTADKKIDLGRVRLSVNSSRVGLIFLGKAYSTTVKSTTRAAMLIHEARHSDCPDGMTAAQVEKLKTITDAAQVRDLVGTCGFTHVYCPKGHPLEKYFACDLPEGWGAYAVGAVYLHALNKSCDDCSEAEKSDALIEYTEAVGRVPQWSELIAGKYGLPDMRQQGYRP